MVRAILYVIILVSSGLTAQNEDMQLAKTAVDTFFEGFHKGDTTLIKSVMANKVIMQTAYRNKEGEDVLVDDTPNGLIDAIAKRPDDQKWDERLLDYSVQVDGNMANVWTPYEFWFNGEFSHCGVNSFQLFKDGEQWKIIYLIDSRRRSTCDAVTSKK